MPGRRVDTAVPHPALRRSVTLPVLGHTVVDESGTLVRADRADVVVAHHQTCPLSASHRPRDHLMLTGMSGTGKSTVLAQLAARGHRTVEADDESWSQKLPTEDGLSREQLWREDRMALLLADDPEGLLFVAGCASNQGRFYDRFDAVVLLSVPVDVLVGRLASRDTNAFGKDPTERERILQDLAEVEPLLRETATAELDTRRSLTEVTDVIERLALGCG